MTSVSAAATTPRTTAAAARLRHGGIGIEVEVVGRLQRLHPAGGGGDHRGVVGAQLERGRDGVGQRVPQLGVRGDAADDRDLSRGRSSRTPAARAPTSASTIARWYDAARSARRSSSSSALQLLHRVEERRLHPGEREVEAVDARDRERERLRIAAAGEPFQLGAAGVAETEQPRALVEGLAGCVVERAGRAPCSGRAPSPRAPSCVHPWRGGTRTAARPGRDGGRATRRGRAGGRRRQAAARAPRPAPWQPTGRRAAHPRAPARASPQRARRRRASRSRRGEPPRPRATRARDGVWPPPPARRRRTARAARPVRRRRWRARRRRGVTSAAAVSSQEVSSPRITPHPPRPRRAT